MSNVNLKLIDFITKTNNITGVSFASIRNYTNSSGEVANHFINLGATLTSAKAKDLTSMKKTTAQKLYFSLPNKNDFSYSVFEKAFNELYDSLVKVGDKNFDGTIKYRNSRSFGQINAYTVINPSVKVHNEKEQLYIYALRLKKEVLKWGEYKSTNKQHKTICKDAIKKVLDFKSAKFVMYIVSKADVMNLAKTSFNGTDLEINL